MTTITIKLKKYVDKKKKKKKTNSGCSRNTAIYLIHSVILFIFDFVYTITGLIRIITVNGNRYTSSTQYCTDPSANN